MSEIDEIWKAEAIERMADNDRVITAQAERVAVLEFHLEKLRGLIYEGYMKTAGVAPAVYVEEAKPKRKALKNATS